MIRKASILGGLATGALVFGLATPAFASGPTNVKSGDIAATVTVQDTISMTGVGNSVPFGSGSPGDTLDVPGAITPVITVLHHGGATLNAEPENGGFKDDSGLDTIDDSAVTVNGKALGHAPVALEVVPTNTTAKSDPEDWSLTIPTDPEPGGSFTQGALTAEFDLTLIAN